jgi:hypothetical protein
VEKREAALVPSCTSSRESFVASDGPRSARKEPPTKTHLTSFLQVLRRTKAFLAGPLPYLRSQGCTNLRHFITTLRQTLGRMFHSSPEDGGNTFLRNPQVHTALLPR